MICEDFPIFHFFVLSLPFFPPVLRLPHLDGCGLLPPFERRCCCSALQARDEVRKEPYMAYFVARDLVLPRSREKARKKDDALSKEASIDCSAVSL